MEKFKSGYTALIGRPNVGKSTLLNAVIGERVSIVTPKPQTTRHKIAGILNQKDAQIIFLDTPGYHRSDKPLNKAMNEIVGSVVDDVDVVCLLIEAGQKDLEIEEELFRKIGSGHAILVLNKADLMERVHYDKLANKFRDEWGAKELVIMSALKNFGVQTLVDAIKAHIPQGAPLFPDDIYTEHTTRFLAGEFIREQVFLQMQQEVPYAAAVEMEEFKDPTEENPVTRIRASIIVEKPSQKAMVIGHGGQRIKRIGIKAREAIEELVGNKVFLELNVRVEKGWTHDLEKVRRFGYSIHGF